MLYSTAILLVLMINGLSSSTSQTQSSSPVLDAFLKTLVKTIQTPMSLDDANSKFSLDIMLENDVFTLDDALRLFIQQFLVALYDGHLHLLPEDWDTQYPKYSKIINEINNILDLIGERKLSEISMKDIRPFIKTLTPDAFFDLQRLINKLEADGKKEDESENSTKDEL